MSQARNPHERREWMASLGSPEPAVRVEAVKALAGFADRHSVASAVSRLLDDPDPSVRLAVLSCEHVRELRVERARLFELARHPDAAIRKGAVRALGGRNDPAARKALVAAMDDPDAEVGALAAAGVAMFESADPAACPRLLGALHDPDSGIRRGAASSLAWVSSTSPEIAAALSDSLAREEGGDRLRMAWVLLSAHQTPRVCREASQAVIEALRNDRELTLGFLHDRVVNARRPFWLRSDLLDIFLQDPDPQLRRAVLHSLVWREQVDPIVTQVLQRLVLKGEDEEERAAAAAALCAGEAAPELKATAWAKLEESKNSPHPVVRRLSLTALLRDADGERLLAMVQAGATDSDPAVRRIAFDVLPEFDVVPIELADVAFRLMVDPDSALRQWVACSFHSMRTRRRSKRPSSDQDRNFGYYAILGALPHAIAQLRDTDDEVRVEFTRAVGEIVCYGIEVPKCPS